MRNTITIKTHHLQIYNYLRRKIKTMAIKLYTQTKVVVRRLPLKAPFLTVNKDSLLVALRELEGNALKLYLYLVGNKEGYKITLINNNAVLENLGFSASELIESIRTLREKSFLLPINDTTYLFNEGGSELC